jgi:hypothetical protein
MYFRIRFEAYEKTPRPVENKEYKIICHVIFEFSQSQ